MNENDPNSPPPIPATGVIPPNSPEPEAFRYPGGHHMGDMEADFSPGVATPREALPLGTAPDDRELIHGVAGVVEALLRCPRRVMFHLRGETRGRVTGWLLLAAVGLIAAYGVIVGSFSGGDQWWAAPLKITVGMVAAAAICLPSLYVFASLSGSRAQLGDLAGVLCGLIALIGILLIGFAPVAWLFSQSTNSLVVMGCLHLAFWGVAVRFGLRFLSEAVTHFDVRSGSGLWTWGIIFILVSLQMTTALRPLIGTAPTLLPTEKKFFTAHWSDSFNAPRR